MRRGLPAAASIALAGLGLVWPSLQAHAQVQDWAAYNWEAHGADGPITKEDRIRAAREALKGLSSTDPDAASSEAEEEYQNHVMAGPGTVSGANGRVAVNLAAGNGNQQISSAVVALGGVAVGQNNAFQAIALGNAGDRETMVEILDDAFVGNSGLISLNISAGNQNQSANLALLAIGNLVTMSDQNLAQTRAPIEPEGGSGEGAGLPNDTVKLSDGAFRENSGLVQLNLIGGERNSSANTFQLSISAGNLP